MIYKYPYTDFHELNLDYILKLCRESIGLELRVVGNNLKLMNAAGETISDVTISYATTAKEDTNGHDLTAYLFSASTSDSKLILTTGAGVVTELTIPYAEKAAKDAAGTDLQTYVKNVQVSGNNVVITLGNGSTYNLTVPFATEANHAEEAEHAESADEATHASRADRATADGQGNVVTSSYAARLVVSGQQVRLEALDGTQLSQITIPFATLAENAQKAIERVTLSGNNIIFETHEGVQTSITVPYALKAAQDADGNVLTEAYIASVQNNVSTGEITFYAADGSVIAQLTPTVDSAVHDSYNNIIAEYLKSVVAAAGSDYVVFTKGDGNTVSIKIDYSNRAWKDTNNNIISNTYIAFANFVTDSVTGEPWMVFYNGETAELFRLQIQAVSAMKDSAGNLIVGTYGSALSFDTTNNVLIMTSPDGTTVSTVVIPSVDPSTVAGSLVANADGSHTDLVALDGTTILSSIWVPFAIEADHAGQADSATQAFNDGSNQFIQTTYLQRLQAATEIADYGAGQSGTYENLKLYNGLNSLKQTVSLENVVTLRYATVRSIDVTDWDANTHVAAVSLAGLALALTDVIVVARPTLAGGPSNVQNAQAQVLMDNIVKAAHIEVLDDNSTWSASGGTLYLYADQIPTDTVKIGIWVYGRGTYGNACSVINCLPC